MTNVTIILTWYSVMRPSSQRTCCSLIQALLMWRIVLDARLRPSVIASSKLFDEVALISDTLATDMEPPSAPDYSARLGGTGTREGAGTGVKSSPGLMKRSISRLYCLSYSVR